MPGDPFHIDGPPDAPLSRAALRAARPLLEWALQLGTLRNLYVQAAAGGSASFADRALEVCGIRWTAVGGPNEIPARGPLVVAANHPHGALDGLVLASIIAAVRPDVRLLANHLLARIPEMSDLCCFVDPFGGPSSAARSTAGLRDAHLWLRKGGALIVFPAGEVANRPAGRGSNAVAPDDSPWHTTTIRLAQSTGARIVPALIEGGNSTFFYAAGRLHPLLRTALLPREFLARRGQTVTVRFGAPLDAKTLGEDREATRRVRASVDDLAVQGRAAAGDPAPGGMPLVSPARASRAAAAIAAEIAALPAEALLVEGGGFQVFCAEAAGIPATLGEIGRLREVTFRAAGEGTGLDTDLDRFDDHYLHLFSWDPVRRLIVGAYRIGRTDHIVAARGVDGLYTRTLFRYDERLLARLSPALELGRSFVRAEYQRNYNALLVLWKGIGRFVGRHPEYRILFGPVSISTRYSDTTHRLLMAFLRQNHQDESLAELVEALNPRAASETALTTRLPRTVDEMNRIIERSEIDGKGIPVLLRQYLKLNARLLGFNVDHNFGDALDALMMVDLTTVAPAMLTRYFGREDAARFLQFHQPPARIRAA